MPLLGRHKSLPGSGANQSSGRSGGGTAPASTPSTTTTAPTTTTTTSGAQQQPLVCESPLFGVRRQLPVAVAVQSESERAPWSAVSALSSSASLSSHLGGAGGGGGGGQTATSVGKRGQLQQQQSRDGQLGSSLSSIPKQISRQQIHYAFSMMDTNSDGLIDLRDLSQMLANLGVPIDEAILSHVMAPVSKRGDHLISEGEFLDWIGNFIQVSQDEPSSLASRHSAAIGGTNRGTSSATPTDKSVVSRSASVSQSLAAQSPEAQFAISHQLRQRRGSGSGLALVRSLSSTSAADDGTGAGDATGGSAHGRPDEPAAACSSSASAARATSNSPIAAALKRERLIQEQAEARRDLKAAFCVFDLDGDGFITIDEVQQGLKLLGESWPQSELNQLFSRCDSMNDSSSNNNNTGKSKVKQQTTKQRTDLTASRQRISIDEFVHLLL